MPNMRNFNHMFLRKNPVKNSVRPHYQKTPALIFFPDRTELRMLCQECHFSQNCLASFVGGVRIPASQVAVNSLQITDRRFRPN